MIQPNFSGGVAIADQNFEAEIEQQLTEKVEVRGNIIVAPDHVGQTTNLFAYAGYTPPESQDSQRYMVDAEGQFFFWNGDPLTN